MSWIEQELQRRQALAARPSAPMALKAGEPGRAAEANGILTLWDRFEAANQALPEALRLRRDVRKPHLPVQPNVPKFLVWLIAPNGAGLGLTDDGIRYLWSEQHTHKSQNFWIRWSPDKGYRLLRRVGPALAEPVMSERRFKTKSVEHIVRCLVTDVQVSVRAVSRRRFWWFF